MPLPMNLIMESLRTMAFSQAAQSHHNASVRRAELKAKMRELEIAAEREKVQAQKEIIERLIALAQHMYDRKIDFFTETFRATHSLIEQHQRTLTEERVELRRAWLE